MKRAIARVAVAWMLAARAASATSPDGGPKNDGGAADASAVTAEARAAMDDAQGLVVEWSDAAYARRRAITDALATLDDRAVPALVVAKRKAPSYGTRAWAAATLEAMGKERADEQIRTRSDDVLAAILRAFGEARDPDALGVVTSLVDSDRATAREAARSALLAYGDDALTKLRQDYANVAGKAAPKEWEAPRIARELYTAFDRARLREVYELLDHGLALAAKSDLAGAVDDFDRVLARSPDLDRRDEVIGAYVQRAIQIEDTDELGARATLEKARRIDPSSARTDAIAGELAYLDARDLEARGAPDADGYRRALTLDGANLHARSAIERLDALAGARATRLRRWQGLVASLVALALACVLFVGRRARRHAGS